MTEAQLLLWNTANNPTGQGSIIAHWLMSMYNGYEYQVNLTDLRALDKNLKVALVEELLEDSKGHEEVHLRWGKTDAEFARMRKLYNF